MEFFTLIFSDAKSVSMLFLSDTNNVKVRLRDDDFRNYSYICNYYIIIYSTTLSFAENCSISNGTERVLASYVIVYYVSTILDKTKSETIRNSSQTFIINFH